MVALRAVKTDYVDKKKGGKPSRTSKELRHLRDVGKFYFSKLKHYEIHRANTKLICQGYSTFKPSESLVSGFHEVLYLSQIYSYKQIVL